MRRSVFGPRRPLALPAPTEPVPSQLPGTVTLARETVPPEHPARGAVAVLRGPLPPLTQQQPGGVIVVGSTEPPRPDQLAGRVAQSPWGLVQPVQRPTPSATVSSEPPRPEAGRAHVAKPPYDNTPKGVITVARGADAPPWEGIAAKGTSGFPDARRPARPPVAKPECERAHPGAVSVAKPPAPALTQQQPAFVARIAATEEPPPFPGWLSVRQQPLVPSVRLRGVPLFARTEEPQPAPGCAVLVRVTLGHAPPGRVCLFAVEPPRPTEGQAAKFGPAIEAIVRQQMPGRVCLFAVEPPRPEDGRARVADGHLAGATPPVIT